MNVQNALKIGDACMEPYENKFLQGGYDKISSPDATIDTPRKGINMGTATTIDTEVIFNKTLVIIDSGQLDLHGLFSHELFVVSDESCMCRVFANQIIQYMTENTYPIVLVSLQRDSTKTTPITQNTQLFVKRPLF